MTTASPTSSSNKLFIAAIAAIAVLGLLAVAIVATARDGTTAEQTAAVQLVGDRLTQLPDQARITDPSTDPEAGRQAPTLTATDFEGDEVVIGDDGRPKAIYFLAHWCPHCQEEVPVLQDLIDGGRVPDGLDIYAVSTAVDVSRGNHPPEAWLEREGFSPPTVRDDASGSAFTAFGGTGFPYAVYLDADNQVVARSAGNLPPDAIVALWDLAAGS